MTDAKAAITSKAAAINEQAVTLDSVVQLLMILEEHAGTTVPMVGALRVARSVLDDAVGKIERSTAAIETAAQDMA